MDYIDDQVESVNQWEMRQAPRQPEPVNSPPPAQTKALVGKVEKFYDKIGVVAITLTGELKVGDIIEIGTEEDAVRQKISSMQIDRVDVEGALEGDSVGIKLRYKVDAGSDVYKL